MPRYCSANITTGAILQVRRDISESNDAEGLYKLYMFPKRGRLDGWDGYQQHTNPTRRGNVDCQIHRLNHETVSATVPGSHFCGYTHAHTEFAEIVQADRIMKLKKVLYTINLHFPLPLSIFFQQLSLSIMYTPNLTIYNELLLCSIVTASIYLVRRETKPETSMGYSKFAKTEDRRTVCNGDPDSS